MKRLVVTLLATGLLALTSTVSAEWDVIQGKDRMTGKSEPVAVSDNVKAEGINWFFGNPTAVVNVYCSDKKERKLKTAIYFSRNIEINSNLSPFDKKMADIFGAKIANIRVGIDNKVTNERVGIWDEYDGIGFVDNSIHNRLKSGNKMTVEILSGKKPDRVYFDFSLKGSAKAINKVTAYCKR